MAIKPCRECGKEISTKAKTCPNCGAKVGSTEVGCIPSLVIIIAFLFLMAQLIKEDNSAITTTPNATQTAKKTTQTG